MRKAEKQVTHNSHYLSQNQFDDKKDKRKKTVKRQWLCLGITFLSIVMMNIPVRRSRLSGVAGATCPD